MKIHCFQHVHFEALGSIESWIHNNDHQLTWTRYYAEGISPIIDDIDGLIIVGGPMNIYQESKYPWLKKEKHLVGEAIEKGKFVLGICLGAQLIADVLGARIYPNRYKEMGWFPLKKSNASSGSPLAVFLQDQIEAFHWHGDTFDLPTGSIPLASTAACDNQGFIYENRIVALQFHLETTRQSAEDLIHYSRHEMVAGPFIQTPDEILSDESRFDHIHKAMNLLLDQMAETFNNQLL
jgi:GMP synthase (glutamine-hydrolysing)